MKLDFTSKHKKTEAEWIKAVDDFWISFTPKFFQVVEWLFVLGALKYLGQEYNLALVKSITAMSFACMFFYINALLYKVEFRLIETKSPKQELLISLAISTALIYLFLILSEHVIDVISAAQ